MIFTPSPVTNSHTFLDPAPGPWRTLWTAPVYTGRRASPSDTIALLHWCSVVLCTFELWKGVIHQIRYHDKWLRWKWRNGSRIR